MALESTTYQCPSCNGPLHFEGASGSLACDYCGSHFSVREVEDFYAAKQEKSDEKARKEKKRAKQQESAASPEGGDTPRSAERAAERSSGPLTAAAASTMADAALDIEVPAPDADPIQTYLDRSKWDDAEADTLRAYNCPACGAQLMVDQVTAVTSCPYCGNNAVLPGQLSDLLKPDYVIPFSLDKETAKKALLSYYQGKPFLPDSFKDKNHIEEVQGVYVPFWLYTTDVQGSATYDAYNIRTWSDSDYDYTETSTYRVYRTGSMHFDAVPVDGSTKMPDAHMDAIEPFDYSALTPFSVAYLPGYLTDRYDLDAAVCRDRAETRMKSTVDSALRSTVTGYSRVDSAGCNVQTNSADIAYALLPVWMLHTTWNGEDFLFAMNGQTGKLIGDLPVDKGKVVRTFFLWFLPLGIVLALVLFVLL